MRDSEKSASTREGVELNTDEDAQNDSVRHRVMLLRMRDRKRAASSASLSPVDAAKPAAAQPDSGAAKDSSLDEIQNGKSGQDLRPSIGELSYAELDSGNLWNELNAAEWRQVVGLISSQGMERVRGNPVAFGAFVQNAPRNLVPPWDLLEAATAKKVVPSTDEIRVAVDSLSAAQKTTLRARIDILSAILPLSQSMLWPIITLIGFQLKDQIRWLNDLKVIDTLDKAKWAQLITEAPKAQQDALIADPVLWPVVEENCDPAVLQVARQNTTNPATTSAAFEDPVQVSALFSTLGAVGFLAVATQANADVKANYNQIKAANKISPVLDGLPVGSNLGESTRANLRRWFYETDEHDAPTLQKMVHVRFGMTVGGSGGGQHAATVTGIWTEAGMRQAWPVLERLPPAHIEGNSSFAYLLLDQAGANGNADYYGKSIGGDNAITMGAAPQSGKTLATEMVSRDQEVFYRKNPDGSLVVDPSTGKPVPVDMNMPAFDATLRHEIGHSVDEALNLIGTDGGVATQGFAGGWTHYPTYAAFVDAVIAAAGGMRQAAWPESKDALYREVAIEAVTTQQPFLTVLATKHPDENASPALEAGPLKVLWDPQRYTQVSGGNGPWYDATGVEAGGRLFLQSYAGDETSLFSFMKSARDAHLITQYQWRSPWEWFAEGYQVYYAEQEKGPSAPVGALLRSKDSQTADLISGLVDRGYSPQDMRGAVKKAPGT